MNDRHSVISLGEKVLSNFLSDGQGEKTKLLEINGNRSHGAGTIHRNPTMEIQRSYQIQWSKDGGSKEKMPELFSTTSGSFHRLIPG